MSASLASPQAPGEQAPGQSGGAADQSQQHGQTDEGGKHSHRLP
jgi:hypothetical protein